MGERGQVAVDRRGLGPRLEACRLEPFYLKGAQPIKGHFPQQRHNMLLESCPLFGHIVAACGLQPPQVVCGRLGDGPPDLAPPG